MVISLRLKTSCLLVLQKAWLRPHALVLPCWPIADREIEGIDSFEKGDRISILIRAVYKTSLANRIDSQDGIAASHVLAESATIARASVGGQSILEVSNADLTRLQAALARSFTSRDELRDRSHLVAVAIQRETDQQSSPSEISAFNPLENVKTTEMIIGGRRTVEVFGGRNQ